MPRTSSAARKRAARGPVRYRPTAADRQRLARQAPLPQPPDDQIDFSDAPESTPEQLAAMQEARTRRLAALADPATTRPKQPIAIRIDTELLAAIRALAAQRDVPYQTLLHQLLAGAVLQATQGRR